MIKQIINVDDYWKVIVYYNIDYNLFSYIANDLYYKASSPVERISEIKHHLLHDAKAVTVSSIKHHISIVAFNKHNTIYDYINSIVHEAEHVKQAMLKAYNVEDEGEAPAYTIGYLVMKMLTKKILKLIMFNNM